MDKWIKTIILKASPPTLEKISYCGANLFMQELRQKED